MGNKSPTSSSSTPSTSLTRQVEMKVARGKMSEALTSLEGILDTKNKDNQRKEPKSCQKEWNAMHKETRKV
jgi:hypothetical protein